ncbi:nuclear transport factor 2 family protein [Winogradskyella flava]|uniref:Nuclear transport factor 2 family protein n=1 Tax=Winogradskyella flava TaxID=1884876 RepID=A0A842IPS9_9FLAO|nr:nuclear transport factor 2 family protein [Winogradskyella flava]MBC2845010.1 nuclear transport factor 2 family protein [Winogradskyella flava]
MSTLEVVKAFYNSDLANDSDVVSRCFHKDCELHWTNSQGFKLLKYNDLTEFFNQTRKAFDNLRFEFTHLIESGSTIVTRHTLFGSAIEDSSNETALGHFSAIWEIKDGKLYRGYEISQQADENNAESMASFSERKI